MYQLPGSRTADAIAAGNRIQGEGHELRGISHFWLWAETRGRPLSAATPPPAFAALPACSEGAERQAYPSGATPPGR
jgi:hypothetical protein